MSDKRVHVRGLKELDAFMKELPAKVEGNILRGALRAGAVVIQREAKALAPVDSGTLRDGLKVSTRSRRGKVTASVKATGKHAFIAPWMEYGTAAHQIAAKAGGWLRFGNLFAKSVAHPGIAPRPFMRPALDNRAQQALQAAGEYIKKRLTKQGIAGAADVEVGE